MPMEGMPSWPISDRPRPLVPSYVQMPGRPRTERIRGGDEPPKHAHKLSKIGTKIKCSLCGNPGHNMRKCNTNPNKGKYKNRKRKKETKVCNDFYMCLISINFYMFCTCEIAAM